jgi:hypothetical protein
MTITYSIWQGSWLLSINNTAKSMQEIEKVINELNNHKLEKQTKFSANIMKVQVNK